MKFIIYLQIITITTLGAILNGAVGFSGKLILSVPLTLFLIYYINIILFKFYKKEDIKKIKSFIFV